MTTLVRKFVSIDDAIARAEQEQQQAIEQFRKLKTVEERFEYPLILFEPTRAEFLSLLHDQRTPAQTDDHEDVDLGGMC